MPGLAEGKWWNLLLLVLCREEDGLDAGSKGTDELFLDASDCCDAASK